MSSNFSLGCRTALVLLSISPGLLVARAFMQTTAELFGPYNGAFLADGLGLTKDFPENRSISAGSPWTMYCWIRSDDPLPARTVIAGIGGPNPAEQSQIYLAIVDGRLSLWSNRENAVSSSETLDPAKWHFLAVTYDGSTAHLFHDGAEVGKGTLAALGPATAMHLAPHSLPRPNSQHFAGEIAAFTVLPRNLTAEEVRALFGQRPNFDLIAFEAGSKDWLVQTRAQAGMRAPQDPATLPESAVPPSRPVAKPSTASQPLLSPRGPNEWAIAGAWRLAAAPDVNAAGEQISRIGFVTTGWLDAVVPGTVLTTLIDRGVYPDPDYGLNNLAIPESLKKHDYWYRTEFTLLPPSPASG